MIEILHIAVGQCGNQIGAKVKISHVECIRHFEDLLIIIAVHIIWWGLWPCLALCLCQCNLWLYPVAPSHNNVSSVKTNYRYLLQTNGHNS
jgi:hypothetical protein